MPTQVGHITWAGNKLPHRVIFYPAQPGSGLEGAFHALPGRFGQVRRSLKITGRQGMVEGFCQVVISLIPRAGAKVVVGEFPGLTQALAQEIRQKDDDSGTNAVHYPAGQ